MFIYLFTLHIGFDYFRWHIDNPHRQLPCPMSIGSGVKDDKTIQYKYFMNKKEKA